jgi:hypothetical protein
MSDQRLLLGGMPTVSDSKPSQSGRELHPPPPSPPPLLVPELLVVPLPPDDVVPLPLPLDDEPLEDPLFDPLPVPDEVVPPELAPLLVVPLVVPPPSVWLPWPPPWEDDAAQAWAREKLKRRAKGGRAWVIGELYEVRGAPWRGRLKSVSDGRVAVTTRTSRRNRKPW